MDESRIKGQGQDARITRSEDLKAGFEVEPDLSSPRALVGQGAWLRAVALLYTALSFPLLLLSHNLYFLFASTALALVTVGAALYLWILEVLSSGPVAVFVAWMLAAVVLQWMLLDSIYANV